MAGLRILWFSAPMWTHSGYGRQTWYTVKALSQLPEIEYMAVACKSGFDSGGISYAGIDHVAAIDAVQSDRNISIHMKVMRMDVCISLLDVWPLARRFSTSGPEGFKWIPIVPVDGDPLATGTQMQLEGAWSLIAMSKFGQKVMAKDDFKATYIPHCVDTKIFRPMPDQPKLKRGLGVPEDCFLVGMVAANTENLPVTRKGFSEGIKAFAAFSKEHSDARLYIHSPAYINVDSADILGLCRMHGLDYKLVTTIDSYMYHIAGVGEEDMARIYSAMDVYFAPSAGEGFNVPLIEAQSCGVPVVANACSSQIENVGVGWLVEPLATIAVGTNTQWELADPLGNTCQGCGYHKRGLVDALEDAYTDLQDKKKRRQLAHDARKFASRFDVDAVTHKYWKPFLAELSEDLDIQPTRLWTPDEKSLTVPLGSQ